MTSKTDGFSVIVNTFSYNVATIFGLTFINEYKNWRRLLHMCLTDAAYSLTRCQHYCA